MTTNSQRSTTEPKNKNKNNQIGKMIIEMEIMWKVISREGEGGKEWKGTGNKKRNWQVQNRWGG